MTPSREKEAEEGADTVSPLVSLLLTRLTEHGDGRRLRTAELTHTGPTHHGVTAGPGTGFHLCSSSSTCQMLRFLWRSVLPSQLEIRFLLTLTPALPKAPQPAWTQKPRAREPSQAPASPNWPSAMSAQSPEADHLPQPAVCTPPRGEKCPDLTLPLRVAGVLRWRTLLFQVLVLSSAGRPLTLGASATNL